MNTQASSAIGLIITIWAAGFGLLGIQLSNIEKLSVTQQIFLSFGQISIFMISNVMIIPMSLKSGENLQQMVSIGTYIQVFFDYLSQKNSLPSQYAWETADKIINHITNSSKIRKRDRLFNAEYTILSIVSLIFIIVEIAFNYDLSKK